MNRDSTTQETITYVQRLLDDNLHLLKVIQLRRDKTDELFAIIEETTSSIEEIAGRWANRRPNGRVT